MAAVKQNGNALKYASEELRQDAEMRLVAAKQSIYWAKKVLKDVGSLLQKGPNKMRESVDALMKTEIGREFFGEVPKRLPIREELRRLYANGVGKLLEWHVQSIPYSGWNTESDKFVLEIRKLIETLEKPKVMQLIDRNQYNKTLDKMDEHAKRALEEWAKEEEERNKSQKTTESLLSDDFASLLQLDTHDLWTHP